jgi:hypothetical protein
MQVPPTQQNTFDWVTNASDGASKYAWFLQYADREYERRIIPAFCGRSLPSLSPVEKENNALFFYLLGQRDWQRNAYWLPDKECKNWVRNPREDGTIYVREVRSKLQ